MAASKKAAAPKKPAKKGGYAPKPNPNAPVGSGGRAAAVEAKVKAEGGSDYEAGAVAGMIARKKYGKAAAAKMSAAGRKRAAAARKAAS